MTSLIDAKLIQIAMRNHGVCRRSALLEGGISSSSIGRRVSSGLLRPIGNSTYRLSGVTGLRSDLAAATAAVSHSAASHFSALHLHGLPVKVTKPEVLTHKNRRRRITVATVHETTHLPEADLTVIDSIGCTTAERGLCDVVFLLRPKRATFLVDTALSRGVIGPSSLIACHLALCRRGRPGTVARRAFLDAKLGDDLMSESELERRLLRILVDRSIHGVTQQFLPPWFDGRRGRVDFAIASLKVILEADGRSWHQSEQSMANDRQRDRIAASHGWVVLRFTWHELDQRPDEVGAEIVSFVAQRSRRMALTHPRLSAA